jgi:Ca2+/H+ antiporter
VVAGVVLVVVWGRDLGGGPLLVAAVVLAAAVHHSEVVAHRVGEPFGWWRAPAGRWPP